MLRSSNKNYDKYNALWEKFSAEHGMSPWTVFLRLLLEYTKGWNSTHKKAIQKIIQPYFDEEGKFLIDLNKEPSTQIFYGICKNIPEQSINPEGSLAAIFEAVKDHTKFDIKIIYRVYKYTLTNIFLDDNNLDISIRRINAVIVFLLGTSENYSTIFTYLPKDITLYICTLVIQSIHYDDKNTAYAMICSLLDGYCGLNNCIPNNYEKYYFHEIKQLKIENITQIEQPLFNTAGGILFQLSILNIIKLEEVSKNDGLHFIFNILHKYFSINITDFYSNSSLVDFFNRKRHIILQNIRYDCWIKMMLDNGHKFTREDIELILSRPYFSTSDKNTQIELFIEYLNKWNYQTIKSTLDCIDLILPTDKQIAKAFQQALKHNKYNAAIHLFCHSNHLSIPDNYRYYQDTPDMSIFVIMNILHELITNKTNPSLLILLLNHASEIYVKYNSHQYQIIINIYSLILKKKHFITGWETVKNTLISSYILDMNHFFHTLICDPDSRSMTVAIDLLESNTPGINILKTFLSNNFTHDILTTKPYFFYDGSKRTMTALQAAILLITTEGMNAIDLINAMIRYDKRCLFIKDNKGRNVLYYLDSIQTDKLSMESQTAYQELYPLIKDEVYKDQRAMTFFSGASDAGSSIATLPENAVNAITSLAMRQS